MSLEKFRFIAIEGVIGAGKTTLADMLSQTIGATTIFEEFEQNPFLSSISIRYDTHFRRRYFSF